MGGDNQPAGPDFSIGVPESELPDGGMLLGQFEGEAVLLVRTGGDVSAIGATCSHYSGPLAEGLLTETGLRCPWHHACFDPRTGRVIRNPALTDLPRWRVERSGNLIFVREKLPTEALTEPPRSADSRVFAIIGAGAAGLAAADELRREGFGGRIVMIDADAETPYDRPNLSKDYLAGNAPPEWIPIHDADFYREHDIERRLGEHVTSIDVAQKSVSIGDESIRYDALLIATGASPVHLPIPDAGAVPVHYLRTFSDSRAIVERAGAAKKAVVIGASFIGLEVAASLRTRGLDVHVVAPEEQPLERILGGDLARFIRSLHEEKGVVFHLGHKPAAFTGAGVTLDDGSVLAAEFIVVGVGVRPNVQLAESAGLRVENGIVVDAFMESSIPDVFAAGDVARYPDPATGKLIRVEHWVAAQRQGQHAAHNMLGRREPFATVPFFWSAHYDATISYVGHAETWNRVDVEGRIEDRDCKLTYWEGGRRAAVATIFRDKDSLFSEVEMEKEALAALEAK